MGGIVTQELDVDLVVGIFYSHALTVLVQYIVTVGIQNELSVVRTGAGEEGTCCTGICRGLHLYDIVAIMIVILGTGFACGIGEFHLYIVQPGSCLLLSNTKTHNAVFIEHIGVLPHDIEYIAVGPTVGAKQNLRICAVCEVNELLSRKRCVCQLLLGQQPAKASAQRECDR